MVSSEKILRILLKAIGNEPMSVHQIVCKTGLDNRTIKKYLNLMVDIQRMPRFVKEQEGLRVLIRRENPLLTSSEMVAENQLLVDLEST